MARQIAIFLTHAEPPIAYMTSDDEETVTMHRELLQPERARIEYVTPREHETDGDAIGRRLRELGAYRA